MSRDIYHPPGVPTEQPFLMRELRRMWLNNDLLPLLAREPDTSLKIDAAEPRIDRIGYKVKCGWVYFHEMYPCEWALMHSHSWAMACLILDGGYEHGIGYSEVRNKPPATVGFITHTRPGDLYYMEPGNFWHYTRIVAQGSHPSWYRSTSVCLVGKRIRERKAVNNTPLTPLECADLRSVMEYQVKNPKFDKLS